MVELKKDERTAKVEGDKVIIHRVTEEEYELEEYMRAINNLKAQTLQTEKQIEEIKKIESQISSVSQEVVKKIEEQREKMKKEREEAIKKAEAEKNGQGA